MKRLFLFSLLFTVFFSVKAQTPPPKPGPYLKFAEKTHEFADIYEGDSVKYVFKFVNEGTAPLILSEAIVTCGCTTPTLTKDPVMPGASGEVKVVFKSAGKMGIQNKVVTILSNATNNPERISIRVNVLPAKVSSK